MATAEAMKLEDKSYLMRLGPQVRRICGEKLIYVKKILYVWNTTYVCETNFMYGERDP